MPVTSSTGTWHLCSVSDVSIVSSRVSSGCAVCSNLPVKSMDYGTGAHDRGCFGVCSSTLHFCCVFQRHGRRVGLLVAMVDGRVAINFIINNDGAVSHKPFLALVVL